MLRLALLEEIAEGVKSSTKPELPQSLVGLAMRAGVELVAGVAVGAGVGYGLDLWSVVAMAVDRMLYCRCSRWHAKRIPSNEWIRNGSWI